MTAPRGVASVGTLAGLLLACSGGCEAPPPGAEHGIRLQEIRSWTLETEGPIGGAAVRGDTVLYWSMSGHAGVLEPEGQTQVAVGGDLRFVGGVLDPGRVVLVSGEPVQTLVWDARSMERRSYREEVNVGVQDGHSVFGAVKADAWYVHIVDLDSDTSHIVRLSEGGQEVLETYDVPVLVSGSHENRLLVLPRRRPQWIDEVSRGVIRRHRVPEITSLEAWTLARGRAVVVQSVPLDGGEHLMTIADLGSDQRWLARLGRGWRVLSSINLVGPIGVVASDTLARHLLMSRVLGEHELVLYKWWR